MEAGSSERSGREAWASTPAPIELTIAVRGVTPTSQSYDLAVVGAGICGLAHALAAARRGKRVVVIDRDAQANGASIRNFGFITVTGQQAGECWRRAKRSVEVWLEIADAAKIPIVQRGLLMIARRPEARAVIEPSCKRAWARNAVSS